MVFDRFDVVEAHYLFYSHYHSGGGSRGYKQMSRILYRMRYRPSPLMSGYASLNDNSKAIYDNLVERYRKGEIIT